MSASENLAPFQGMVLSFLRRSEALALCLLDPDLLVLDCNRGFLRLFQLAQKPQGRPLLDFLGEEALTRLLPSPHSPPLPSPPSFLTRKLSLSLPQGASLHLLAVICQTPQHLLLLLEETHLADPLSLETIAQLNSELTNLSRELAQKNKQLEQTNATITRLMNTDPLTGLANRRHLLERLQRERSLSLRQQLPLSLILCDLDHFKQINDSFGHNAGDEVLVSFANLLQENTRHEDLAARWGGEEFLLALPATPQQGAAALAQRLCQQLPQLRYDLVPRPVTASFGVAQLHKDESLDSLIHRADQALYQAKEQGRHQVALAPSPP